MVPTWKRDCEEWISSARGDFAPGLDVVLRWAVLWPNGHLLGRAHIFSLSHFEKRESNDSTSLPSAVLLQKYSRTCRAGVFFTEKISAKTRPGEGGFDETRLAIPLFSPLPPCFSLHFAPAFSFVSSPTPFQRKRMERTISKIGGASSPALQEDGRRAILRDSRWRALHHRRSGSWSSAGNSIKLQARMTVHPLPLFFSPSLGCFLMGIPQQTAYS